MKKVKQSVKQNHKYYDILSKSQRSSGVEQRFRKPLAVSSNLTAGSINILLLRRLVTRADLAISLHFYRPWPFAGKMEIASLP